MRRARSEVRDRKSDVSPLSDLRHPTSRPPPCSHSGRAIARCASLRTYQSASGLRDIRTGPDSTVRNAIAEIQQQIRTKTVTPALIRIVAHCDICRRPKTPEQRPLPNAGHFLHQLRCSGVRFDHKDRPPSSHGPCNPGGRTWNMMCVTRAGRQGNAMSRRRATFTSNVRAGSCVTTTAARLLSSSAILATTSSG